MTLNYLLDTNILSEAIRAKPNQTVMENLEVHKDKIATATIVIHELFYGCFRLPTSKKRQDLENYVNDVILSQLPIFN
jgi:tRNA(fMet)-specific endonuclease VapC